MKLSDFEAGLDRPFFLIAGAPGHGGAQRPVRGGRDWGPHAKVLE
jgi:hypothetical protein